MDMIETNTSQLKAKLGSFMRAVRAGKEVVVKDRDQPVARLIPYRTKRSTAGALVVEPKDPAAPALGQVRVKGIGYRGASSTSLLLEDRARR